MDQVAGQTSLSTNIPLVSVAMTTYNHKEYIAEALESALFQKTDFNFEIIIGEDNSSDGTREIVQTFFKNHPERIIPIFQTYNIGGNANFESVLNRCRGKYITILEGDDYWTSPLKLQKQFDFLENNPDYSTCFHNAKTIQGTNKKKSWNYCEFNEDQSFSLTDILKRNFIPTASSMFRNYINEDFLSRLRIVKADDWFIHVFNAEKGKIFYINECMSVYRSHSNGQWAGLNKNERIRFGINTIFEMNRAFDYKYENEFKNVLVDYSISLKDSVGLRSIFRYMKSKIKIPS
jgi:glycosyltransferase involved in cell wall biosynthesis